MSYYDDIFGAPSMQASSGPRAPAPRASRGGRSEAPLASARLAATPSPSGESYSDPRLRGISTVGLSGMRVPGASRGGRAYAVTHPDPYADVALKEMELGRRLPLPYQTPTALAGMLPMRDERYQSQYVSLHSERAVNPAAGMAGRRMTQSGTFGADYAQTIPWNARDKFGYGRMGSRGGGGYDEIWDVRGGRERRSGRLSDTTKFSQAVNPEYPFLHLVARGDVTNASGTFDGNARCRVTAGLSETGGAEVIREFWLGGGLTARFDMKGWDQVTVEILDILDGTNVQFAWVTHGMESSDAQGTLFLPQRVARGVGTVPVPEGAYAVVIEDPAIAIPGTVVSVVWTTFGAAFPGDVTMSIDVDDGTTGTNNQFGQPLSVLGSAVSFGGAGTLDVVWLISAI